MTRFSCCAADIPRFKGKSRRKKAVSSIVGGIILFGMLFSIGFGYFYAVSQAQATYQSALKQYNTNNAIKSQEYLLANGVIISSGGTGVLGFAVNNSGISVVLEAYYLYKQSSTGVQDLVQYMNGTSSPASSPVLPYSLAQGASVVFNTGLSYTQGITYTFKVLTQRGTTVVGKYPTPYQTSQSYTSVLAAGLGSLEMVFNSFDYYTYTSGPGSPNLCSSGANSKTTCASSPWAIDITHPHNGALSPFQCLSGCGSTPPSNDIPIAFSAQVINNDPNIGPVVVGAHTNVWTLQSCQKGCGTFQLLTFFVMNVASNGQILSTTDGSFQPVTINYGQTVTLYFGAGKDLSTSDYTSEALSPIGTYTVAMSFYGSKVSANNATIYGQNIPFASTYVADNLARYTETPTSCSQSVPTTFTLTVTNSQFSGESLNEVKINTTGSSFTSVTYLSSSPNSWQNSGSGNMLILTPNGSGGGSSISPGDTMTFLWSGTPPAVSGATQSVFVTTFYWSSGAVTSQIVAMGCVVS